MAETCSSLCSAGGQEVIQHHRAAGCEEPVFQGRIVSRGCGLRCSPKTRKSRIREISAFCLVHVRNALYTSICFLQCFLVISGLF